MFIQFCFHTHNGESTSRKQPLPKSPCQTTLYVVCPRIPICFEQFPKRKEKNRRTGKESFALSGLWVQFLVDFDLNWTWPCQSSAANLAQTPWCGGWLVGQIWPHQLVWLIWPHQPPSPVVVVVVVAVVILTSPAGMVGLRVMIDWNRWFEKIERIGTNLELLHQTRHLHV